MNLDQIIKLGAFQGNAVKQDGSLVPFISMPELISWANDGNLEIEKMIRSIFDDYFAKFMNTTLNVTAQKLLGILYTPSITLQIPALTSQILLPPDFETLRSIRCVSQGQDFMEFEHQDMGSNIFQQYLRVPQGYSVPPGGKIYYDIVGERTLYIAPQMQSTIDLEIVYIARTKRLVRYITGTVTVADGGTGVTGVGTVWQSGLPLDGAYCDMMFGATTFASVDPSWEYDGTHLARLASITNDTTLTLAAPKVGLVAGGSYILSSLPVFPPEHHHGLADYVAAQVWGKAGNEAQYNRYNAKWEARKRALYNTINVRQPDVEFVEGYENWA